jgi:hypothetical protein
MMRMTRRLLGAVALAGCVLLAAGADLHAQRRIQIRPRTGTAAPLVPVGPGQAGSQNRAAALPQDWVEQLQEMTPPEQERFLRNNDRFRSLAPRQQALIRQRLRAWNNLPSKQREAILERQQIWEQMSLEQRRQVRESLLPRWQTLPVSRRQIIMGKLRELRGLDGAQRSEKLNDDAFLGNMNEEDRQMLRELSALGVGEAAG